MGDIKQQLEYFRDNSKYSLAVVISRPDQTDRVVKMFPRTKAVEAEQYAQRSAPSRITDVRKGMEVIGVYLLPEQSNL